MIPQSSQQCHRLICYIRPLAIVTVVSNTTVTNQMYPVIGHDF